MTYKEFTKLLEQNKMSILAYMRLAGLNRSTYEYWKRTGRLPKIRAMQVRMLLGVSDANKTTAN